METEYPDDDAGCAEYNKYLEAVSTAENSPNMTDSSSQEQAAYARNVSPSPNSPNYSGALYQPNHQLLQAVTGKRSPANTPPNALNRKDNVSPAQVDINGHVAKPLVPYVDTPVCVKIRQNDNAQRLNITPSSSPLTFIREEPNESTAELL